MPRRLYVYYLAAGLNRAGEIMFAKLFRTAWDIFGDTNEELIQQEKPDKLLIAEVDDDRPFAEAQADARQIAVTALTNRQLIFEKGISSQGVVIEDPDRETA